jgi:Na+-driven multidrug efflux pump
MHLRLKMITRPQKEYTKEIFSIGVPRAFEEFCSGVFLLAQRWLIILAAGTAGVMMHSLAFAYLDLMMVIPDAVGAAIITVGSACVGQKNRVKLNRGFNFAIIIAGSISLLAAALLFLFPDAVLSLFLTGDVLEYRDQIVWAARLYSLILPLYVFTKLSSYFLQIIRKSKMSAYGNLAIGLIKTGFNTLPVILCIMTFEAAVWAVMGGYAVAAVIMITVAIVQVRKFDIESVNTASTPAVLEGK